MKWIVVFSLYCMCVIKCLAMSPAELEDFSIFLQETSQLDQNVKSNIPNDYDDDASVSDHAWEESGKFEGDLILNDRQRRMIVASVAEGLARNGISDTTKRWPNNEVIYYIQTEHFSNDQIQAIQNGIDDLARASCVKFTPYKKGDRDAVVIQGSRRGCFSQVGYQGGYQILNLSSRHPAGRGCFRHGTVVHEMLHTLGFYHMQSSPDRDDYIDVFWPNIIKNARHNFRKYNSFSVSDYGVGYDYDSVLHYSRKAFSVNGQDTLVPKQLGATIGQRIGLSEKDVEKLNKMYCDIDSDHPDSDDSIQKLHKKKHKNKPFEGLGLGYQKGKTVIIKLPKAYQFQDSPQYTAFDYFSKPEGQNPLIQGARAREEMIINNFKIPNRTIMKDHPPIEALKQYHTPADDVVIKSYNAKQNTQGTLSDHFGDDLTEFYKLSLIKDPQTQVKQPHGDDYDGELHNFGEYSSRDEENPSKYTDFSHPSYSPKQSSGRYLPLAIHEANNSFKNSFSDEQNTPVREKWFNADEFKKNYRGGSPSSFDYR